MSPAGGGGHAVRTCTATTGFFVLTRCERNARTGCARCRRSICGQHAMVLPGEEARVCPECYAAARGYVNDPNDPDWATGFRRSFYWEVSSTTGDDTWWMTFDDFDRDSFAEGAAEGEGWADDGDGADFLDS